MARVYSTSYFHYTKNLDNLKGILQNGFNGYYCKEDFKWYGNVFSLYVPMVSFCDIPLSMIDSITYGEYAIGMSSVWGNAIGICPICYFPNKQDNPLTKYISKLAYNFMDTGSKVGVQLFSYAKSKNKYSNPHNYSWDNYKERECRRVHLNGVTIDNRVHGQVCPQLNLQFSSNQITFIIVKDECDRVNLIDQMTKWTKIGGRQTQDTQLLCSRILTKQDIRNNF